MFTINIEDMKIVGSLIYLFLLVALYFDNNFVFESVEAKTKSEILTYFDLHIVVLLRSMLQFIKHTCFMLMFDHSKAIALFTTPCPTVQF